MNSVLTEVLRSLSLKNRSINNPLYKRIKNYIILSANFYSFLALLSDSSGPALYSLAGKFFLLEAKGYDIMIPIVEHLFLGRRKNHGDIA